eukprot:TRINITY_DN2790_c0_g1_i20.p2 TRINITY_DN2790_c0_g1~~TRINITY_DN2790_c0_g1_i20.p2  ORF type:complete len:146 (-),score=76.90 TRINITY_DN2790_c0_g1_i20:42-479(-)
MTKKISSKKSKVTKHKTVHKKEKKHRKPKDKNAPKRSMSAFFCYLKARRDGLKKEQPSLSNTEIISKMSDEWKAFSAREKEPYNKAAEKDKERYAREKKIYEEKKKRQSKEDKGKEASPKKESKVKKGPKTVSYTHLTLPTICSV